MARKQMNNTFNLQPASCLLLVKFWRNNPFVISLDLSIFIVSEFWWMFFTWPRRHVFRGNTTIAYWVGENEKEKEKRGMSSVNTNIHVWYLWCQTKDIRTIWERGSRVALARGPFLFWLKRTTTPQLLRASPTIIMLAKMLDVITIYILVEKYCLPIIRFYIYILHLVFYI